MVQVYGEPLQLRHYSPRCSVPYCFRLCSLIGCIILAYAFVFTTGGLWVKSTTIYTQAKVDFESELLVILEGAEPGSERVWSTYSALNEQLGAQLASVSASSHAVDSNHDGKPDQIIVSVSSFDMPAVHSIKVLMQFRYEIDEPEVELGMKSLAFVSYASPVAGSALYLDGDLELVQREPLPDGSQSFAFDEDALPLSGAIGDGLRFENLLGNYLDRNETTHYRYGTPVWYAGRGGFTMTAKIRIPSHQPVVYRPGVLHVLKLGWVQFLATFLVLFWILRWVEWVAFHFRILDTRVVSDTAPKLHRF
mmetsp:Transcript_57221/g.181041  ORF Transcript_57221/g.181041 Transcript_57221/m.181041 type:complete len:307 (-) Transcript_57221:39-959(-)